MLQFAAHEVLPDSRGHSCTNISCFQPLSRPKNQLLTALPEKVFKVAESQIYINAYKIFYTKKKEKQQSRSLPLNWCNWFVVICKTIKSLCDMVQGIFADCLSCEKKSFGDSFAQNSSQLFPCAMWKRKTDADPLFPLAQYLSHLCGVMSGLQRALLISPAGGGCNQLPHL